MDETHFGSCLCGQVKFKAIGNFARFYLCHCTYCQKDTGSAHAANVFAPEGKLIWLSGGPGVKTFNLPATKHSKSFCKNCGSALPSLQMEGRLLVVPAGSLDTELTLSPNGHIFYVRRATWDNNLENFIKFGSNPEPATP